MVYRGHIKNGVVVFDDPVTLPEGVEVQVEAVGNENDIQSLREGLLKLAGTVSGLPSDMARNHDHHIHGTPRK